jgi:hypothetical protein
MKEPLYRKSFESSTLLDEHPPQFRHPHKAALFEIAYPDYRAGVGVIDVTRWAQHVEEPISLPPKLVTDVYPNFYDYKPVESGATADEWHVNFADPLGASRW